MKYIFMPLKNFIFFNASSLSPLKDFFIDPICVFLSSLVLCGRYSCLRASCVFQQKGEQRKLSPLAMMVMVMLKGYY